MRNLGRRRPQGGQTRAGVVRGGTLDLPAPPGRQTRAGAGTRASIGQVAPLEPGRLGSLVLAVARLYRKAHLTAEEARYVQRRVRQQLGLRGRPQRAERLPEILNPDELARVLAQAYRERGLYGLLVRTLFETGLRVSELIRVETVDVDFLERTIRVREGKGSKDRIALFTEDLGQQLRLHLAGRSRCALFESNRSAPFTARRVQQIVKATALRAGVAKPIHPHTYRHSMATFLRNQGVPLDVVQLLRGHVDPRTTQLYARLSLGTARAAYDEAMGKLRAGQKSPGQSASAVLRLERGAEARGGRPKLEPFGTGTAVETPTSGPGNPGST